jgi:hypothetical protein
MNLRRGLKRITFILSLLVALIAAALGFVGVFDTWNHECNKYNIYKNNYEDITNFWLVWDEDGWVDGKYKIISDLLNSPPPYVRFRIGDKEVVIEQDDVFPGINEEMLHMSLDVLDKKAQTAKEIAILIAKNEMQQYEWWGKKGTDEAVLLSVLTALGCAAIGYLGTWVIIWFGGIVIYKFIRWLISGFHEDEKVSKIAEQIAEGHNKDGVTLTDPKTGKDLLAEMTDEQREKYRQFKIKTGRMKQE